MTEREYELTFEVSQLSEELVNDLMDEVDATVALVRGVSLVTITTPGVSALAAATSARLLVEGVGVSVARCVEDLVTLRNIAERVDVTPQAVGNWARGDRQVGSGFPNPFVVAGGGLWLWGEVLEWVRRAKPEVFVQADDGIDYPTRSDHAAINGQIETSRLARTAGWVSIDESRNRFGLSATGAAPVSAPRRAPNSLNIEPAA